MLQKHNNRMSETYSGSADDANVTVNVWRHADIV